MPWNWQHPDRPNFIWDAKALEAREARFLQGMGIAIGTTRHLDGDAKTDVLVELMTDEAVDSSAIEGETLDRASVQSSIQKGLGLAVDKRRAGPAEAGMAELMVNLYKTVSAPLTHEVLHSWHSMLCNGRRDLQVIGGYRQHTDPMQIISGAINNPHIHFEAPPSTEMQAQMTAFLDWFNRTAPNQSGALPPLTRAGIAHLWFECVHPYEDGNGRIGRVIAEKALAQSGDQPVITGIARAMKQDHKAYYAALEQASKSLDISAWLDWFADTTLKAQVSTRHLVEFKLAQSRIMHKLSTLLNDRQKKVLLRMFREGPQGFKGGLSAANYVSITKTSPATARRDLAELVEIGVLQRTGEKKGTRYHLRVDTIPA